MFLNLLNPRMESFSNDPAEFQIDDIYSVPGNFNKAFSFQKYSLNKNK
jgi:hypothetical protein